MKKGIITVVALLLLLGSQSCGNQEAEDESILDALIISTWVLDADLEGSGYWAYNETPDDYGYWVPDDGGETLPADEVFKYERLELGVPRVMAPMGFLYHQHINLDLNFDGIIEVSVGEEGSEYVRLIHSLDYPEEPWRGGEIEENQFRAIGPLTVEVNPTGKFINHRLVHLSTLTDCEYFLNVKTYDYDGTQIITAKLKLMVIKDKGYPYQEIPDRNYGPYEERSRFLSIELVSYEFSDKYKFEQGLVETE